MRLGGYSKLPTSDPDAHERRMAGSSRSGATTADALAEQRNQEMTESLSAKVNMLKLMANDVHVETRDQTFRMLSDTQQDMSRTQALFGITVNRLNNLVTKISTRTTCRIQCMIVLFVVGFLFVLYLLFTKTNFFASSSEADVESLPHPVTTVSGAS